MLIPSSYAKATNVITLENAKKGTTKWQHADTVHPTASMPLILASVATINDNTMICDPLSSPNFPNAVDDCVAGYTSTPSVNKGQSIVFKISVNPAPQSYSIDFYRMGWYNGTGATLVSTVDTQLGLKQPDCPIDYQTGLTECNWSDGYTLNVPVTWTTGIYIAVVTNQSGWKTNILFVVRDDNRAADFLYQLPILTYAAYTNYPINTPTGKSLYDIDSSGPNTLVGTPRAVKISLDRPTHHQFGNWLGTDWSEVHLVAWLEKMGYNLNYTTDLDVHTSRPGYLESYKGIIIGGHSEYWTKTMYDKAEYARNAGTNLAFFGANAAHWQVRMEKSSTGIENRVLTCYKDELNAPNLDPIADPLLKTMKWRDLGRAEQTLIGVQHDLNGWNLDTRNQPSFIVKNSNYWAYTGSALTNNTTIPYIVGYEIDNLDEAYPKPPLLKPTSQTILGESPFTNHMNEAYISQASIYQAPSGAWVFGSGTMSWSWGLARQTEMASITPSVVYQNAGLQRVTKNMLDNYVKTIIEPLETKVLTTYQGTGFSGISQSFGFGKYLASHKELNSVGDNAISSFKIKPGYTVKMCTDNTPDTGICEIYTTNMASLEQDDFDEKISYIEVKPAINLALNKKASQSSTYANIAVAARAVDGDTDGSYAEQSVSMTKSDLNAWWQVDLGQQYNLHNILLGSRLNCCINRLANFYVFISKTDLTGRSFSSIINDASVWRYQMQGQVDSSLSVFTGTKGRYVRVQLADKNYLSLREVLIR